MKIKNRNSLVQNVELKDAEKSTFNILVDFFYSEQLEISSPECCYRSACGNYDDYEWEVTSEGNFIGLFHFGRHHLHSGRKFYFEPIDNLEYDYSLIECVPEANKAYVWTEQQKCSLLYSPSDARSDYSTY